MLMALGPYFFRPRPLLTKRKTEPPPTDGKSKRSSARPPCTTLWGREQTLQLEGTVYADYHDGLDQIPRMKEAADKGEPLMLVDGLGNVLGQWVILTLQEKQTFFRSNGLPRKSTFALNLKKYDDRKNNILCGFLK